MRTRSESLDIVRTLAAVGVLLFHSATATHVDAGLLSAPLGSLNLGVMVFFSLSGYLVTRPLLTGTVTPIDHLSRRLVRIVPAYVVAVAAWPVLIGWSDPMLGGVAWTLLLEAAFYAALPFLVAALPVLGGSSGRQVLLLLALALASLAALSIATTANAIQWHVALVLPMLWLWAFVPGMLVAMAQTWYPRAMARLGGRLPLVVGSAMVVSVLVVPAGGHAASTLTRMALVATGTAVAIPCLLRVSPPGSLARALAMSGRTLSYPVYLWHPVVILWVATAGIHGWAAVGASLALTLVVAACSWQLVERPTLRLADRLLSARLAPTRTYGGADGTSRTHGGPVPRLHRA